MLPLLTEFLGQESICDRKYPTSNFIVSGRCSERSAHFDGSEEVGSGLLVVGKGQLVRP